MAAGKRGAGAAGGSGGAGGARRATGKVGADPKAARAVGGGLDFGIKPADAARRAARGETFDPERGASSRAARPGVDLPRDAGAGKPDSGPGSNSGGDLDTDFTGVGTAGGLAQDPPTSVTIGPASSAGASDEFASGPKARGRNQLPTKTRAIDPLSGGPDSGADADRGQPGRGIRADETNRTNMPTQ
jgi:hypothetical protein